MDLYGQKSRIIPQKIAVHFLEIIFISLSYWILFLEGGNWFAGIFGTENLSAGSEDRRIVLFLFHLVVFLRLGYMMFFLLKRRIPWEESISVPFAFALYYIGFSLLVLPTRHELDGVDLLAIAVFVIGSVLNTGGEVLRSRWKKDPANKGKIYTGGFFKYSRHINYFGDILWVSGYAILTRNPWAALIPIFLFCFFAFYNVPKLDQYLATKYGKGYDAYARKTKKLIPFVY